jgi:hypothetical protein
MFLRAERFDADLTAKRLLKILEWELELFGPEKLCQSSISLADLDMDAQAMVDSGFFQILPARDSRGRVIWAAAANYLKRLHRSNRSKLQMAYYMQMSLAEDEINQKLGMVVIAYGLGQSESNMSSENLHSIREGVDLAHCLPVRIEATHFLARPNGMQYALNLVAKSYLLGHRARLRVHFGTHLECTYALKSFGLPTSLLPFTDESELKIDNHKKWIKRRIVKEHVLARGEIFSCIELPHGNDILLGKGKPFQNHLGNQRLQDLAHAYLDEYNQANSKGGKTDVALKILQELVHPSGGGPFGGHLLKHWEDEWKSGWWEERTDKVELIEKICNTIRGVRKRKQPEV